MTRQTQISLLVLVTAALGCGDSGAAPVEPYEWNLPSNIPLPRVPDDNPMSDEKIELGRFLFYDTKLSANETQSCGSCHLQELAFTDGLEVSEGSTGQFTPRSSMSLANVGYTATLTWANRALVLLEQQARVPMFGENPIELGLSSLDNDELLDRFRNDPDYPDMFASAFPGESDPINVSNITKAIATFQRRLTSFNSPYDRHTRGDTTALNESERRGLELFFGGTNAAGIDDALECFHCHGGFLLSQAQDEAMNVFDQSTFINNGLYNLDEQGSYPPGNEGIFEETADPRDKGKFKPPTLRNIAVTGPYMHDGSIATLDEVIDHYARGGRLIEEGPLAGDGALNPNKNGFLDGFVLTEQERADLKAFLLTLTDDEFLNDPAYSNPFE